MLRKTNMTYFRLAFLLTLLLFKNSNGQIVHDTLHLRINVFDNKTKEELNEVILSVYSSRPSEHNKKISEGSFSYAYHESFNSKIDLPLSLSEWDYYSITIYKKGYIKKIVQISTRGIPLERFRESFSAINIDVYLFKEIPDIDYSFWNTPYVKFCYNKVDKSIEPDKNYLDSLKFTLEVETNKANYFDHLDLDSLLNAKYKYATINGDSAFSKNDFLNAKHWYLKSLRYLNSTYPLEQIEKCDSVLQENYTYYITKADSCYNSENYVDAIKYYQESLHYKPSERYPKDRISLCRIKFKRD